MNLVLLTPGAGRMICGNCIHDNTLVAALRALGHDALMLPLYLPVHVDEADQSADQPVFLGGINVYLEQRLPWFRRAPGWLRRALSARWLLERAAGRAAKTRPEEVGDLLISMLRGEEGHQARELEELIAWLQRNTTPDILCLSNALLVGLARRLRAALGVPVVCQLQGEEPYVEALPEGYRAPVWQLLAERARDVDAWIAPSRWAAQRMQLRLGLPPERLHVVYPGISLAGYHLKIRNPKSEIRSRPAPVLGFFARMCRDKGLDTLVEAYISLKRRDRVPRLKLHVGGSCGPADEPLVKELRRQLAQAGFIGETMFLPNPTRAEKLDFLSALTVFSVPALYGEAFGLYLIEALAAGVPVVQPRVAAFPEILEATGGGVLCDPGDPQALADAIEGLLLDPERARALGEAGAAAVREQFSAEAMARRTVQVFAAVGAARE